MDNLSILLKILLITGTAANLEGPFLFWGPATLKNFNRSALQRLDQDELISIYEGQSAVVVFNNQDGGPVSAENFPRLRRLLEAKTTLVLPQDFLDVHPDYIKNETQVFTLQGPSSERDAAITETFSRLEDIYGRGKVLGVLGNSVSDESSPRVRRSMDESKPEAESTTEASRPEKSPSEFAMYNATSKIISQLPLHGLIYSSRWPVLRLAELDEDIVLKKPLEATVDVKTSKDKSPTQQIKIIVPFVHDTGTEQLKIRLHFRFTVTEGWWVSSGVEVYLRDHSLLLQAPAGRAAPSAVIGKSYHCALPVVYSGNASSLTMYDLQMQPFMENNQMFSDAFDCVGFMTVPIWSGVLVTIFLNIILCVGVIMIFDIKTNDRYESTKGKSLSVTVNE